MIDVMKYENIEGDFIIIQTTLKCNQHCDFCSYPIKEIEIKEKELKETISSFSNKVKTVIFSGGESTLRKELFSFITFARDNGLRARIISNGQNIADKEYCKRLLNCGVDHVTISMQSHLSHIHDGLTNTPGSKEKCELAISNLISLGHPPSVMITVNRVNAPYLMDFVKYLNKRFPEVNSVILILLDAVGRAKNNDKVLIRISHAQKYLLPAIEFLDSEGYKMDIEGVPFCYLGRFVKYSTELNQVRNGVSYYVYELEKRKVIGGKFEDKLKKLYLKPEVCSACSLDKSCPGVNKNYFNQFGSAELFPIFSKDKPETDWQNKNYAEERKEKFLKLLPAIKEELVKEYGIMPELIKELYFSEHVILNIDDYVLKIFDESSMEKVKGIQWFIREVYDSLNKNGYGFKVRLPIVLEDGILEIKENRNTVRLPYLKMRYIPGENLETAWGCMDEKEKIIKLKEICHFIKAVHSISGTTDQDFNEKLNRMISLNSLILETIRELDGLRGNNSVISDKMVSFLTDYLNRYEKVSEIHKNSVLLGEVSLKNFIIGEDKALTKIDFENYEAGSVFFELLSFELRTPKKYRHVILKEYFTDEKARAKYERFRKIYLIRKFIANRLKGTNLINENDLIDCLTNKSYIPYVK